MDVSFNTNHNVVLLSYYIQSLYQGHNYQLILRLETSLLSFHYQIKYPQRQHLLQLSITC